MPRAKVVIPELDEKKKRGRPRKKPATTDGANGTPAPQAPPTTPVVAESEKKKPEYPLSDSESDDETILLSDLLAGEGEEKPEEPAPKAKESFEELEKKLEEAVWQKLEKQWEEKQQRLAEERKRKREEKKKENKEMHPAEIDKFTKLMQQFLRAQKQETDRTLQKLARTTNLLW